MNNSYFSQCFIVTVTKFVVYYMSFSPSPKCTFMLFTFSSPVSPGLSNRSLNNSMFRSSMLVAQQFLLPVAIHAMLFYVSYYTVLLTVSRKGSNLKWKFKRLSWLGACHFEARIVLQIKSHYAGHNQNVEMFIKWD